jgi:hypothetical protein
MNLIVNYPDGVIEYRNALFDERHSGGQPAIKLNPDTYPPQLTRASWTAGARALQSSSLASRSACSACAPASFLMPQFGTLTWSLRCVLIALVLERRYFTCA